MFPLNKIPHSENIAFEGISKVGIFIIKIHSYSGFKTYQI